MTLDTSLRRRGEVTPKREKKEEAPAWKGSGWELKGVRTKMRGLQQEDHYC